MNKPGIFWRLPGVFPTKMMNACIAHCKKILLALAPSFIVDKLRARRNPHTDGYWWEGVYSDFGSVPTQGEGWDSDAWINSRTAYTNEIWQLVQKDSLLALDLGSRFSLLSMLVRSLFNPSGSPSSVKSKRVSVLDFGGAMGIAYAHLRANLGDCRNVDYYVVDNPRACDAGRKIFKDEPSIHFYPQLPEDLPNFEIIFLSGVLQCIQDYRAIIQSLVRYQPNYMLYTYLPAGNIPTFASVMRHLKGSWIPNWFFSIQELIAIHEQLGYQLAFNGLEGDVLDMENFPQTHRLNHMANLLFIRK